MENAILVNLARQMTLRRQMDVVANNLANMETAGFKGGSLRFEEFVMPVAEVDGVTGSNRMVSSVLDAGQVRDFGEGTVTQTGNPLDVAINGDGWLVVQTDNGERFTRNGHLKIDPDGRLVTSDGHPVLGTGGEVTLTADDTEITIGADGTLTTNNGNNNRLRVVRFDDQNLLTPEGNNLYRSEADPLPAETSRVMQGFVEKSNVHPVMEMTRMIETSRAYMSTSRLLDNTGELRQRAIETLGRLQA